MAAISFGYGPITPSKTMTHVDDVIFFLFMLDMTSPIAAYTILSYCEYAFFLSLSTTP